MKNIVLIVLLLCCYSFAGQNRAAFAQDIYLKKSEFLDKYKSSYSKIIFLSANNIEFVLLQNNTTNTIVFQGSTTKQNALTDAHIKHQKFKNLTGSKVHQGFYTSAAMAEKDMTNLLDKKKKTILIGHSLGGSVSLVLGAILDFEGYDVDITTFGASPVGNEVFVERFKSLPHSRYIHKLDIIPILNKNNIRKFKKFLYYAGTKIDNTIPIKRALVTIKNLPYEFVHHGTKIELSNKAVFPTGLTKKQLFLKKTILRPLIYHSMDSYKRGFDDILYSSTKKEQRAF